MIARSDHEVVPVSGGSATVPLLKVCGITSRAELDVLAGDDVDFVGLWYDVPGGPADLPLERLRELATAAAESPRPAPVLVSFGKDAGRLAEALDGTGGRWVQLHGYQSPGMVKKLKAAGLDVIKVLHVRGSECLEESLIGLYERAGVDVLLLDAVADDGRVGSTGQTLDPAVAQSLADKLDRPFLLAGGISAGNRDAYAALAAHPRFLGVDVDTAARGADGLVSDDRVAAIAAAWKTPRG